MTPIILGLGSNIENRFNHLQAAINLLKKEALPEFLATSKIYETEAIVLESAPKEWKMPYLNMAIKANCKFSPEELLKICKEVEKSLGRQDRGRWAPREIDIDILAYGEKTYYSANLIIPHKFLLQRDFAIKPFAEIWPEWSCPQRNENFMKTAKELANELNISKMKEFNS